MYALEPSEKPFPSLLSVRPSLPLNPPPPLPPPQVNLRAIWALSALLVTYRLGVLPAESTAALKLLDKGVAKESLAALVLAQFPVDLVSAVVAGR